MDIEGLGKRLEALIIAKGYIRYDFAKLAGIRVTTLYRICKCGKLPSMTVFLRFLELLHVSADTLLGIDKAFPRISRWREVTEGFLSAPPEEELSPKATEVGMIQNRCPPGELSNEVQHIFKQKLWGKEVEEFFGAVVDEVYIALKGFRIHL